MSIVEFPSTYIKILRNGECFWLHNCVCEKNGKWRGIVDSELVVNTEKLGEMISFDDAEIVEAINLKKGSQYAR